MAFIDNLAYMLSAVSFAGLLLVYMTVSMYLSYKRKEKDFMGHLRSASVPLGIIGLFLLVTALWGQFTWPLPGSYNTLFYDPILSFGILLVAFALSVKYKVKLEYVGFLGLMIGIMLISYGATAYSIGLTKEPVALLVMYTFYGLAGVLSFPAALIADRIASGKGKKIHIAWIAVLALLLILLLLASLASAYIGSTALTAHLVSTP